MKEKFKLTASGAVFFLCFSVGAHQGHEALKSKTPGEKTRPSTQETYESINSSYMKIVKPIFEAKCLACHSSQTVPPWYSNIPGVKSLIEYDRKEAQEHLEMSQGFPFGGHGDPLSDLQAIADSVKQNSMPPLRYKLINWFSGLSSKERDLILRWASESHSLLNK